jgi:hypothetical protein
MTSKKINKANRQIGDQTTKGGLLGMRVTQCGKHTLTLY